MKRQTSFLPSIVTLIVLALALFAAFLFGRARAYRGLGTSFEVTEKKGHLVAAIEANVLAAAEAEKRAVMAQTDEESASFAAEAGHAAAAVEKDRLALGALIGADVRPGEQPSFEQFNRCWERFQAFDREILALAVENSNLKAQRMSFGAAAAAVDRLQVALDTAIDRQSAATDAAAGARAAYRVIAAARTLQGLESQHIAAPRDAEMDALEAKMRTLQQQVRAGLNELETATGGTDHPAIDAARGAYAELEQVHAEILTLSRRNSNVRSLALSLGEKRRVTAECQQRLAALRETVRPSSQATR